MAKCPDNLTSMNENLHRATHLLAANQRMQVYGFQKITITHCDCINPYASIHWPAVIQLQSILFNLHCKFWEILQTHLFAMNKSNNVYIHIYIYNSIIIVSHIDNKFCFLVITFILVFSLCCPLVLPFSPLCFCCLGTAHYALLTCSHLPDLRLHLSHMCQPHLCQLSLLQAHICLLPSLCSGLVIFESWFVSLFHN